MKKDKDKKQKEKLHPIKSFKVAWKDKNSRKAIIACFVIAIVAIIVIAVSAGTVEI